MFSYKSYITKINPNLKRIASILTLVFLCFLKLNASKSFEKNLYLNKSGSVWVEAGATTTTITTSSNSVCKNATSPIVTVKAEGGTTPYTFVYKINDGTEITRTTTGSNDTINIKVSTSISGTFKYILINVTSKDGTPETQTGKEVTVIVNDPPTVDFSFSDNQCSGSSILFTPTISGAAPFKYEWTFGTEGTSTTEKPSKIFNSYGCGNATYQINLVVTDKNGCSTTTTKTLTIKQQPNIDFIDSKNPFDPFSNCSGASAENPSFEITVANNSVSNCISNYSINWGDGNIQNNITFPISYVYSKLGAFNMSITATGYNGCSSSKTYIVKNVSNPSGGLISPGTTADLCAPTEELKFEIAKWGTNSPGTIYSVDYGDGTPIVTYKQEDLQKTIYYNSVSPEFSQNYPIPHSYKTSSCTNSNRQFTAVLTVTSACNSTQFTANNIIILTRPEANFTVPTKICANSSFTIKNTSTPGYSKNCSQLSNFTWDFGDGKTETQNYTSPKDITHTYTKSGNYTITLTANAFCGSTTKSQQICVDTIISPTFTINKNEGCTPLTVITTNTTNEETGCKSPVSYLWEISYTVSNCGTTKSYSITTSSGTATNGTSTLKNPLITFINPGTYKIQLTATNQCGSKTSTVETVIVKAPPIVTINPINPTCEVAGNTIISPKATITNCGTANLTYLWSFPGGTPSSSSSIDPGNVSYSSAGTYKISLRVVNECDTTKTETSFTINPMPVITGNLQACVGKTEKLTGNGTAATSNPWLSSNTSVATINSTGTVTALSAGTTNITYTNSLGCKTVVVFTVYANPTINGTFNVCIGDTRQLTGSGTPATTNPWTSSNSAIATIDNTGLVKGISVGTTTITYTNSTGCQTTSNFIVNDLPKISGNLNGCIGSTVQLVGSGTASTSNPWTSSNITVASVSNSGLVTGKSPGNTIITYTNSNGCRDTAIFKVNESPTVIKPDNQTVCNGNKTLNIVFSGNPSTSTYKWTVDKTGIGINSSGIGNIPAFTAINNGSSIIEATFTVIPSANSCDGNPVQFTITILPSPVITQHPQSTTVCLNGTTPSLSVKYTNGTGTPVYQWYSNTVNSIINGTPIPNANTDSYLPPTNVVGTLYYYCKITFSQGGCSEITSNTASVTVNPLPTISKQPLDSQSICVGGTVNAFSVEYTGGVGNATYQWYRNSQNSNTGGTAISNAVNATFTPPASDFSTAGTVYYYVIVSLNGSGCGSVTSNTAKVLVVPDPVIDSQPLASQTVCQSTTPTTLAVSASGGIGIFSYQWYSNTTNSNTGGTIISQNGNKSTYIPLTNAVGTTYYYCVISQTGVGCQVTSAVATVTVVPSPVITTQPQNASVCLNGTTPNLSVKYTNGTGTPTYQWYSNTVNSYINGTAIPNANTDSYLPPTNVVGTLYYYCKITFTQGGCSEITSNTASVTVNPLPTISKQPLDSQSICVGGTVNAFSVEYTGGVGNATYQWYKNTQNSNTGGTAISNAVNATFTPPASDFSSAGTVYYYVIVSLNGSGCGSVRSNTAKVVVVPDPVIDSQPLASQTVCQSTTPTTLAVSASGGIGIFSYQWYSNTTNSNTGGTIISQNGNKSTYIPLTNAVGTTYYYCVISQTGVGCQVTSAVATVTVVPSPVITQQPPSSVVCKGEKPTLLSVTYRDGTGLPQYQWYVNTHNNTTSGVIIPGANSKEYQPIANNVGVLYYYCIITLPSGGCSSLISEIAKVTVNQYPVISDFYREIGSGKSFIVLPVSTSTDTVPDGTLYTWSISSINPSNSISGAFAQTNSQNLISQTLTNNTKNKATVIYNVKPISGSCEGKNFNITVVINPPIDVVSEVKDITCYGANDGKIKISIQGGNPPYNVNWSGPNNFSSDKNEITNLLPGDYKLIVSDDGGIPFNATYTIKEPNPLSLKTVLTKNVSCYQANDGKIIIDISGGAGKYNFNWKKNNEVFSTSKDIINIGPGEYEVSVTDTNYCGPISLSYKIIEPEPLKIELVSVVNNLCAGDKNGSIAINVSGGTKIEIIPGVFDYYYKWSGPNGFISEKKNIDNLISGDYILEVTDNSGCKTQFSTKVTQPDSIKVKVNTTPISCYGANDATIKIDVTGGISPYTAEWNNYATGFYQENLSANNYVITITDVNSCVKKITVTIPEAPLFKISPVVKQITCYGANNGSIKLNVQGGEGKVTVQWNDGSNAGVERNNLGPGIYIATIKDEKPCIITETFIIIEPKELTLSAKTKDATDCENTKSGAIILEVSGGNPPYKFLWSNSSTSKDIIDLGPGNFLVTVTDSVGCSVSSQFEVKRQLPLIVSAEVKNEFLCENNSVRALCKAKIIGGVPPYTLHWSSGIVSGENNEFMETRESGSFILQVTDGLGCSNSYMFNTKVPFVGIDYNAFDCNNYIYKFNFITSDNLLNNITYLWDFGDGNTSRLQNPLHTYLNPGNYIVKAMISSSECNTVFTKNVFVDSIPKLTLNKIPKFCKNDSIVLKVSGADTYLWSNGSKTDSIVIKYPGDYYVIGWTEKRCTSQLNFKATYFDDYEYHIYTDKNFVSPEHPDIKFWSDDIAQSKYIWDFGDENSYFGNYINHTYNISGNGFYNVKLNVTNPNGCMETAEKIIWIVKEELPNIFAPGTGNSTVFLKGWDLQVFNSNGILLYEGKDGWDGTYKGKPVASDTYYYVIVQYTEKGAVSKPGYVTVVR